MAFMSQERKALIAPAVKAILKKYNVKGSLSINHHSTLVLSIKQGPIDFVENKIAADIAKPYGNKMDESTIAWMREKQNLDINPYWYQDHFTGTALEFFKEIFSAMNEGNYDRSDAMVDYFDVGWYVDVNVGKWNQPYVLA